MASICQDRSVQVATDLEEMSQILKTFGDFREWKDAVSALRFIKTEEFNYDKELVMYSAFQGEYANVDPLLPQVEGSIRENLVPILVSPDSKDIVPETPHEKGEINQP